MAGRITSEQRPGSTRTLLAEQDGSLVRRTVLPGGLRVVTEHVPGVRSVSLGIWVGIGSRDETVRQAGCSHYLEHLLFKGTHRRGALEISAALDGRGGEMNAFTAKEHTCFYARVLDEDVPIAIDVLMDLVTSSRLVPADVDNERQVILEEIAMRDDDPADVVHEAFSEAFFGDTPLGRPILGTVASIEGLSRGTVNAYYRRHYRPENLVVTAAGRVDHAAFVRLVRKALGHAEGMAIDPAGRPASARTAGRAPRSRSGVRVLRHSTEQANVVLGMPGVARTDDRRYALGVLNTALGGGMSSRLFQEVREKRGLAYSVYSYSEQYADTGIFGLYAGCLPKKVDEVLRVCVGELESIAEHGITAVELDRGKGMLRGGLVLGMEDTGARMNRLGKAEVSYGELLSIDDLLGRVAAVTLDDVRTVAADLLSAPRTLAVMGPFAEDRAFAVA